MGAAKTRIFTVYLPAFYEKKETIFEQLQPLCPDVQFTGHARLTGILDEDGKKSALQAIAEEQDNLDGLIIFGGLQDKRFTSFNLPVIMVQGIWVPGDWQKGYLKFYQGDKIIPAALCDIDVREEISAARVRELARKIKLIEALAEVKRTKLLLVQEPEVLGQYDVFGMDYHVPFPDDYVQRYADHLNALGLTVNHVELERVLNKIPKADINRAEAIAQKWIKDAIGVNPETNETEILEAARLYLAMKELVEEEQADGIAIRSLVPWSQGILRVTTCLPNAEFNRQLKVGVCEGLINAAITELFALLLFKRPTFIGDIIGIDRENDLITVAHCQSPVNPHGDDLAPYEIRSHALQKGNKMLPAFMPEIGKSLSAVVRVDLPVDEPVTVVKISVYHKKIAVSSGRSVRGEDYYRDFKDRLCRTKLAIRLNTEAFARRYDTATFGVHRNVIFGDYREQLKDLADLMGYEFVPEDEER